MSVKMVTTVDILTRFQLDFHKFLPLKGLKDAEEIFRTRSLVSGGHFGSVPEDIMLKLLQDTRSEMGPLVNTQNI